MLKAFKNKNCNVFIQHRTKTATTVALKTEPNMFEEEITIKNKKYFSSKMRKNIFK